MIVGEIESRKTTETVIRVDRNFILHHLGYVLGPPVYSGITCCFSVEQDFWETFMLCLSKHRMEPHLYIL